MIDRYLGTPPSLCFKALGLAEPNLPYPTRALEHAGPVSPFHACHLQGHRPRCMFLGFLSSVLSITNEASPNVLDKDIPRWQGAKQDVNLVIALYPFIVSIEFQTLSVKRWVQRDRLQACSLKASHGIRSRNLPRMISMNGKLSTKVCRCVDSMFFFFFPRFFFSASFEARPHTMCHRSQNSKMSLNAVIKDTRASAYLPRIHQFWHQSLPPLNHERPFAGPGHFWITPRSTIVQVWSIISGRLGETWPRTVEYVDNLSRFCSGTTPKSLPW